jgi:cytidylate kinase
MPVITITREMGSLGKDVARGLGEALGVPVVYHEVIDHLADRMRVRKSHVIRLLDGKAGLLERLTADKTSLSIFSADEIIALALQDKGVVIRGWGATHLLRGVPHVVCVRVCAPFELRKRRMMDRLASGDEAAVADEIRINDEAHTAIMRRNFGLQWTEPEHYDLTLNTQRVSVDECVEEVLELVRSPQFAETDESRARLVDMALEARVRAALRRHPETRDWKVAIRARNGEITLTGARSTDEMLAMVEVATAVPGVQDVKYRSQPPEDPGARI